MTDHIEPHELEFNCQVTTAVAFEKVAVEKLLAWTQVYDIKAFKVQVTEIVHWDITLMRGFLHAKVIPAFKVKITEAYPARKDGKLYTAGFIKNFLKHRYLGYQQNPAYVKWRKPLKLDKPGDIMAYADLLIIMVSITEPPALISTEKLEPVEYWRFLNDCEGYYLELFNDMYDRKGKPDFKENKDAY